jgi:transketolase N-terminal domain/subunit
MNEMATSLSDLQIRLLDQCFKYGKHHLGSAFSTLPILKEIFDLKRAEDKVVLSNGHAAAALYVCLEEYSGVDSSNLFTLMGDHPKRNTEYGVDCSTGSLGMGITVAVGMALASPEKNIYCVISDGECAEGAVWEALRYAASRKLKNLKIYVNINNYIAYDKIDGEKLAGEILFLNKDVNVRYTTLFPFEDLGLTAHYFKMDQNKYNEVRKVLCDSNS